MFDTARRLFDRYYCQHVAANTPGFDEHLAQEARVRLCQVHELYNRLLKLEEQLFEHDLKANPTPKNPLENKVILHDVARPPCNHPDAPLRPFTPADEVRISLEAFYYNACRIRDLFRESGSGLPGLRRFEAPGVRDVRNHLVEHPTRERGVRVMAVAIGGPIGPQLKPVRWSSDPVGTVDAGLRANAQEFCSALEATLSAIVAPSAA